MPISSEFSHQRLRRRTISRLICGTVVVGIIACSGSEANEPRVATAVTANKGSSGQTGVAGTVLATPISVHVVDQSGNALPNTTVTWTPASLSGSVSPTSSMTDANGDATTVWTLAATAGLDSLTASIASGAYALVIATATAATP